MYGQEQEQEEERTHKAYDWLGFFFFEIAGMEDVNKSCMQEGVCKE